MGAVRSHLLRQAEDNLTCHAGFIANLMGSHMDRAALTAQEREMITDEMRRLSREIDGRLCIVNWKGEVLEDSSATGEKWVGYRAEVHDALQGQVGAAVRGFEPDSGEEPILYVAVPMLARGKPVGAIYASQSLLEAQILLLGLEETLYRGSLIAVAVAALLSWLLARLVTAPLSRLTRAARRIATGHFDERIEGEGAGEMGALAGAFNDMARNLQRHQDLLLRFVSDASHELKTPLASMRALTEVLEDGGIEDPEVARRFLRHIGREVDRMERLVRDLLQLHRMEGGALQLDRRPVALLELVEQMAAQFGPHLGLETVEVRSSLAPGVEVEADADRVRQVLANLLENSARAVRGRECPRVAVEVAPAEGGFRVTVEDEGVGIPPGDLERVFERFYRVDSSRSREDGGTGLGLAVSRRIVEAHGGRIWAESRPGEPTRFSFTLPAVAEP